MYTSIFNASKQLMLARMLISTVISVEKKKKEKEKNENEERPKKCKFNLKKWVILAKTTTNDLARGGLLSD